ncbi:MAG: PH domain-containing protein [Lentimicrobiaceae bacterium]|nr:PH domain-containing protein [Lentimicrobiaceae bacterium]
MKRKYPSKIGFIVIIPLLICISLLIPLLILGEWLVFVTCVVMPLSLVYILCIPTYYTIDDKLLIIKCGRSGQGEKIDITTIKKIRETKRGLSAPALSLDRIEITYKKYGHVMVSPKNKHDFIQDLIDINPNIEVIYKSSGKS